MALKIDLGKLLKKAQLKKQKGQMNRFILTFKDVDWLKTKAYSFGYYGPIYINTKEKGWGGKVTEKEYFKLREKIKSQLEELVDPETGEKIADKIIFKEELYSGPLTSKLPDIIFLMKNYVYGSSSTFAFASNKTFTPPITMKSGDHRENGIFLAVGPVFSGKKIRKNISIIDIAPTVLKYFGITPPQDIDGKSLLL